MSSIPRKTRSSERFWVSSSMFWSSYKHRVEYSTVRTAQQATLSTLVYADLSNKQNLPLVLLLSVSVNGPKCWQFEQLAIYDCTYVWGNTYLETFLNTVMSKIIRSFRAIMSLVRMYLYIATWIICIFACGTEQNFGSVVLRRVILPSSLRCVLLLMCAPRITPVWVLMTAWWGRKLQN